MLGNNNHRLNIDTLKLRNNNRVNRLNLLDFPRFKSFESAEKLCGSTQLPSFPCFADLRYVWKTPVLYHYPSIRDNVLSSRRVQSTIQELVESGRGSSSQVSNCARHFYDGIRSSISRIWCRFLGWLMFKIFRRLISRLLVVPDQLKELKKAHDTDIPVIYLPLHRSHLDYQIITWTTWHFGCRIQNVASGDNLNLSGFGWLLRATGAFFIKRHLDPNDNSTRDVLYRSILNSYLIELLKSGQSLEFFLEGTRSRIGKTLLPKNGLISNIVEAVENGELKDAYLVPVSVNYDAIVEGIFYHELMGIRKPKENIINVFRGIVNSFRKKLVCGTVCVNFEKPILLSETLKAIRQSATAYHDLGYATNLNSYRELLPWNDHSLTHKTLIRAVGYHIVYYAQNQKPINLSSLIAILFLCKYREQVVNMSELLKDLHFLIEEIELLGYEVVGWLVDECSPADLILSSIQRLEGALLTFHLENELAFQICDCHKAYITLAYHKNNGIAPFVLLSIAAIVVDLKSADKVPINLIKEMEGLGSFLRYEVFLCSPLDSFERCAESSLQFFSSKRNSFTVSFYRLFVLPFMETFNYVSSHLLKHPNDYKSFTDVAFIRHLTIKMSEDPNVKYKEAANSDSVYNTIKALRACEVINESGIELGGERWLVEQIISKIQCFINSNVA